MNARYQLGHGLTVAVRCWYPMARYIRVSAPLPPQLITLFGLRIDENPNLSAFILTDIARVETRSLILALWSLNFGSQSLIVA
jgi:hypothetical protein